MKYRPFGLNAAAITDHMYGNGIHCICDKWSFAQDQALWTYAITVAQNITHALALANALISFNAAYRSAKPC